MQTETEANGMQNRSSLATFCTKYESLVYTARQLFITCPLSTS